MPLASIRPVLVLYTASFMMMAGMGTLTTVLGVRLAGAGLSTLQIGAVMAAYSAGLTLGCLFAYRLVLRIGHIRAFTAMASLLAALILLHGLLSPPLIWLGLRLVAGYCMAGLFICLESWLNQNATADNRGQVLAFYMISLYGGQGLGQFLLPLSDGATPVTIFVLLSILLSAALVPVALTRQTPPTLPEISAFGIRQLYAASPLGLAGVVLAGLVLGAFFALAPVYLQQSGFDGTGTALFMSSAILGGVALQWPLGRLSDRFDRRTVIVGLFTALAATAAAIGLWQGPPLYGLLALAALFGGLSVTIYPVCVAHTNDFLSQHDLVPASGGLILGFSVGATAGPFLASAVMAGVAAPGLFLFSAGVAGAGALYGLWRMRMRPALPNERQGSFQPLPRTTPVVAELDPRGLVAAD